MTKTLLACALAVAGIGQAFAADIVIVNVDPAGQGLNDPTPARPVGGNPGKTVGEQRRIVFQFAADQWGAILQSTVPIRIESSFAPLTCAETSGVLAQAGALTASSNFANAPVANSFYNIALANAIAGSDLSPGNDIVMTFQANLGQPGCLTGSSWYYGLDGVDVAGGTDFLDTAMHEMGHGLNFQGRYNLASGAPPALNRTDIYSTFVVDNASGLAWTAMTNAQRVVAAKGDALVWNGANVTAQVPAALNERVDLVLSNGGTGSFEYVAAAFGTAAPQGTAFQIVAASDTVAPVTDGCDAYPAGALAGKVALVDRGLCSFKIKARNAQAAGAVGVLVANNVAAGFPGMGDDPATPDAITIWSLGITQAAGTAIRAGGPSVQGTLQTVPGQFAGADTNQRARLYAPAVLAQGSSFSHYDVSLTPDAIMEPFSSPATDANFRLDLTPALFKDVGWVLNTGDAQTRAGTCDTGLKVLTEPGLIAGANLQAADRLCRATYPGVNSTGRLQSPARDAIGYKSCINGFVQRLATAELITPAQLPAIVACTKP